ncbi:hypothetical protein KAU33_14115 [Candidatus Dependentiae bacterium]|nr:hypothetical protein [Candidatus Dependentiae bacterium]
MKVKGKIIQSTVEFVKAKYGEDALTELLKELTPEERDFFQFGICKDLFYPVETHIKLTDLVVNKLAEGDINICREIGEFTAERDRKNILKLFYKLGPPHFIMRLGNWNWKRFYDEGEVQIMESSSGHLILDLKIPGEVHRYVYERILGWMKNALVYAGAKNIQLNMKVNKLRDLTIVRFHATWE